MVTKKLFSFINQKRQAGIIALLCFMFQACAMDYNQHLPEINRELVELDSNAPQLLYIHRLYGFASLLALQHRQLSKLSERLENSQAMLTTIATSFSNDIEQRLEKIIPFPQELKDFFQSIPEVLCNIDSLEDKLQTIQSHLFNGKTLQDILHNNEEKSTKDLLEDLRAIPARLLDIYFVIIHPEYAQQIHKMPVEEEVKLIQERQDPVSIFLIKLLDVTIDLEDIFLHIFINYLNFILHDSRYNINYPLIPYVNYINTLKNLSNTFDNLLITKKSKLYYSRILPICKSSFKNLQGLVMEYQENLPVIDSFYQKFVQTLHLEIQKLPKQECSKIKMVYPGIAILPKTLYNQVCNQEEQHIENRTQKESHISEHATKKKTRKRKTRRQTHRKKISIPNHTTIPQHNAYDNMTDKEISNLAGALAKQCKEILQLRNKLKNQPQQIAQYLSNFVEQNKSLCEELYTHYECLHYIRGIIELARTYQATEYNNNTYSSLHNQTVLDQIKEIISSFEKDSLQLEAIEDKLIHKIFGIDAEKTEQ